MGMAPGYQHFSSIGRFSLLQLSTIAAVRIRITATLLTAHWSVCPLDDGHTVPPIALAGFRGRLICEDNKKPIRSLSGLTAADVTAEGGACAISCSTTLKCIETRLSATAQGTCLQLAAGRGHETPVGRLLLLLQRHHLLLQAPSTELQQPTTMYSRTARSKKACTEEVDQDVSKGVDDYTKNEVEDNDDDHEEEEQSCVGDTIHLQDEVIFEENVANDGEEVDQDERQHSVTHFTPHRRCQGEARGRGATPRADEAAARHAAGGGVERRTGTSAVKVEVSQHVKANREDETDDGDDDEGPDAQWLGHDDNDEQCCQDSHPQQGRQVPVVILTKQLEKAKDGLHDNNYKTHFSFVLVLVPSAGLAVGRVEVVLRVCFTPIAGIYGHRSFDLQLGQFHAVVENPKELLGFLVFELAPGQQGLHPTDQG
ncbi:hypothetical protein EYF80_008419 [Liparis tanakae]|uniref:Uncharacterized protein n=1 Tax=Liparis tanakae TaxID=230148 RepID=A0A4Z2IVW5_9TELE|nr:hypothetical protein EYF80_008419 [Liparis tanakae]